MRYIEAINLFKYIKHDVNQGKGAVNHTGIAQATGDYLLERDADLENGRIQPGRCGIRLKIYGRQTTPHPVLLAPYMKSLTHT